MNSAHCLLSHKSPSQDYTVLLQKNFLAFETERQTISIGEKCRGGPSSTVVTDNRNKQNDHSIDPQLLKPMRLQGYFVVLLYMFQILPFIPQNKLNTPHKNDQSLHVPLYIKFK